MNVHCWADGFGLWHARVTEIPDTHNPGDLDRARRAARSAIMAELVARSARGVTARDIRLKLDRGPIDRTPAGLTIVWTERDDF